MKMWQMKKRDKNALYPNGPFITTDRKIIGYKRSKV